MVYIFADHRRFRCRLYVRRTIALEQSTGVSTNYCDPSALLKSPGLNGVERPGPHLHTPTAPTLWLTQQLFEQLRRLPISYSLASIHTSLMSGKRCLRSGIWFVLVSIPPRVHEGSSSSQGPPLLTISKQSGTAVRGVLRAFTCGLWPHTRPEQLPAAWASSVFLMTRGWRRNDATAQSKASRVGAAEEDGHRFLILMTKTR